MDDQEMLKMAAAAAGVKVAGSYEDEATLVIKPGPGLPRAKWNPLTDDGDELLVDPRYPYTHAADYLSMKVGDDYGKGLISRAAASQIMSLIAEAIGHDDHYKIACALADKAATTP